MQLGRFLVLVYQKRDFLMEILPSRLGQQNTPTASLQRGKTPPPSNECPDMILNHLMVKLQF